MSKNFTNLSVYADGNTYRTITICYLQEIYLEQNPTTLNNAR